jgi:hypothetical protein
MFFFIRCAFWLTIVFHAMTWTTPASQDGNVRQDVLQMASEAAGTLATAAGTAVTAKLEESCAKAPAGCLALAARLPQIVATTAQVPTSHVGVPKWPLRLAELDAEWPALTHKPVLQHD